MTRGIRSAEDTRKNKTESGHDGHDQQIPNLHAANNKLMAHHGSRRNYHDQIQRHDHPNPGRAHVKCHSQMIVACNPAVRGMKS